MNSAQEATAKASAGEKRKHDGAQDQNRDACKKPKQQQQLEVAEDPAAFWSVDLLKELRNELKGMRKGAEQEWGKAAEKVR